MIKARLQQADGKPLLFLGLTWENVAALREGRPMLIDLAELGVDAKAVIHYGHDAAALMNDLRTLVPDLPEPEHS